jgi:hypothetical protein
VLIVAEPGFRAASGDEWADSIRSTAGTPD